MDRSKSRKRQCGFCNVPELEGQGVTPGIPLFTRNWGSKTGCVVGKTCSTNEWSNPEDDARRWGLSALLSLSTPWVTTPRKTLVLEALWGTDIIGLRYHPQAAIQHELAGLVGDHVSYVEWSRAR